MASVNPAKQVTEVNIHEVEVDQASPLGHPQDILQTCAAGQWSALQMVLAASGISAPAPAITMYNQAKYALPQTHKMVEAAIRGKQHSTIEHIYKMFPSARSEY